jgi:hypothetical protein
VIGKEEGPPSPSTSTSTSSGSGTSASAQPVIDVTHQEDNAADEEEEVGSEIFLRYIYIYIYIIHIYIYR